MDVSVIYVTYNCSNLTIQSIESVFNKTEGISYEIIIVDNGSKTLELESLKHYCKNKNIKLIEANENLGFGRANNLGSKYACGKYLFFLNPDTLLINNAAYELYRFAEKEHITTCGGNLYDINMNPTHSYWMIFPSVAAEISTLLSDIPLKIKYKNSHEHNHTSRPIQVGYITGADLMIRNDLFEKINGFDSDFFLYFEETELQHRIKILGEKIYNVPSAKIIHLESQTIGSKETKLNLLYKSRRIYFFKALNNTDFTIANIIIKISCHIRILIFSFLNKKEKINFWKATLNQIK